MNLSSEPPHLIARGMNCFCVVQCQKTALFTYSVSVSKIIVVIIMTHKLLVRNMAWILRNIVCVVM